MIGMENKMAIRLACDVQAGASVFAFVCESRRLAAARSRGLIGGDSRG